MTTVDTEDVNNITDDDGVRNCNSIIGFDVSPFYYRTNGKKLFRTTDRVRIEMPRKELIQCIKLAKFCHKIYDPNTYIATLPVQKLQTDIIKNGLILINLISKWFKGNKKHELLQSLVDQPKMLEKLLTDSVKYIYTSMLLLKSVRYKFPVMLTDRLDKTTVAASSSPSSYSSLSIQSTTSVLQVLDERLKSTIELYWDSLDDILLFRPIYSMVQNILPLMLQIYILLHCERFNNNEETGKPPEGVEANDCVSNRLGCYIQHVLLQGKDDEMSNVYNRLLYSNKLFTSLAMDVRNYIRRNESLFGIHISPTYSLSDDLCKDMILRVQDKKGIPVHYETLVELMNAKIKPYLEKVIHIHKDKMININLEPILLWHIFKGFCQDTEIDTYKRHTYIMTTHILIAYKHATASEKRIKDIFAMLLEPNFITTDVLRKWLCSEYYTWFQDIADKMVINMASQPETRKVNKQCRIVYKNVKK